VHAGCGPEGRVPDRPSHIGLAGDRLVSIEICEQVDDLVGFVIFVLDEIVESIYQASCAIECAWKKIPPS
jgi:hypothetical protein